MMSAGNFITRQSKLLLENKQYAILCAVILSIVPFSSWISVALVSLIALRKGAKSGFEVMLPALVIHSIPLLVLVPLESALINTLVAYIPCYLAALTLRQTKSWQMVFGVLLIQAVIAFLAIQLIAPNFVIEQFNQLKQLFTHYKEFQQLMDSSMGGLSSMIWAQLFFGIQILSVVVSATISLMFARSIQAKLFLPGGFKQELSEFRSGKLAFLVLIGILIASYYEILWALNLLPLILCYFLISGFNLVYIVLARKRHVRVFILLFLLILFKPSLMLFAYIIFGSLDSLFNFRLYLPVRANESI
ncbi:MAG: hypothetical protein PSV35_05695 [bacterium]|nr:hypothetical protein [bacterium]